MSTRAADAARALVDAQAAALPRPLPADANALAVALKDEAIAAWGTTPARASCCAALLRDLRADAPTPAIGALADWAAGLAALSEGRMADAAAAFDAAHTALTALGRAHEAAQTQVPKLIVLAMLGRHEEALRCAHTTLAAFLAADDQRSAGKVELNLGTMLSRRDRHAEAARWFRSAAVRAARAGDRELSIRADIALANALTWQHGFDEALRINERARVRAERHGHTVLSAHAHQAIGRIELNRGRWHVALRELAAACRLLEQSGASPQQRIEAEAALADAYLAVHLLPEARALYDRVIHEAQRLQAPTERAWALLQRARADALLDDAAAARDGFAQARGLYVEQENAAAAALVDLAAGALELASGRPEVAAQRIASAGPTLAASGILDWQLEGRALQAAAHAALGDAEGARQGFEAALAAGRGLTAVELACRHGLAALAWQRGDDAGTRQHAQAALALVDAARAALPGELFRSAIGAHSEAVHDLLVRATLAQDGAAAELLAVIDQGRARALALSFAEHEAPSAPQAERTALAWTRERWRNALAEGDAAAAAALATQVGSRETALLEAARRRRLDDAAGRRAGAPRETTLDVPALQRALADDEALVVYHRLPERLVACVVTPRGVQRVETACDALDARLQGLRFQIDALRHGRALPAHAQQLLQRARSHLQALHALLWAPLAGALGAARRVALVPHRGLHYVPFAALHDGQQWLVETHELRLLPSAGWRGPGPHRGAGPPRALALGFGAAGLPQAAAEAEAVAAAFGPTGLALTGEGATQAALRAAAGSVDVLHLACHGEFRADNPLCSSLELADGPLSVHDVQSLRLQAALVALSACETGVSRIAPGDESLGLVRAFLLAGAQAVLASQWAVDDASTAALMGDFHRRRLAGASTAAALAAAQRRLAHDGAHPFHWAAFSVYGWG